MSLDKQPTRQADRVTYLRDDVWRILAVGLLTSGLILVVIGFLLDVRLAVSSVGLTRIAFGIWVLARPVGLVILEPNASICLRGLVTERHAMFSDIFYIGVQPSEQDMSALGLPYMAGDRYDVVVHLRGNEALLVHSELQLSAARLAVERPRALTRAAVSEAGRTQSDDSWR